MANPPPPNPTTPPRTKTGDDEKKDGKVVLEQWDAAYFKGQNVGYFHVVVREYERDGKKFVYATKEQKLTVARFGQIVEQWGEDSTIETAGRQGSRHADATGHRAAIRRSSCRGGSSGKCCSVKGEGDVRRDAGSAVAGGRDRHRPRSDAHDGQKPEARRVPSTTSSTKAG